MKEWNELGEGKIEMERLRMPRGSTPFSLHLRSLIGLVLILRPPMRPKVVERKLIGCIKSLPVDEEVKCDSDPRIAHH